ncbi:MAG: hypothetical protein KGJ90_05135 [Patescibacteria group bacterium]|nr:hypothetical protein [Patescibacteria group bacterium]
MSKLLKKLAELPENKRAYVDEMTGDATKEQPEKETTDEHTASDTVEASEDSAGAGDSADQEQEENKSEEGKKDEQEKGEIKDEAKEEKEGYKQRKAKKEAEAKEAKERAERAEKELEEYKRREEYWRKAAEQQKQSPTVATKEEAVAADAPDPKKDPAGYIIHELTESKKKLNQMETQQLFVSAHNELSGMESEYRKKAPDYDDVLQHAEEAEVAKGKILFPQATEAQIRQNFKNQKVQLAIRLIQAGRDPVEGIYNYAKNGYGYIPKSSPAKDADAAEATKAEIEKKRFEAVKKNKGKSATGLSAGASHGDIEERGAETTKGRTLRQFARLTKDQKDVDYR